MKKTKKSVLRESNTRVISVPDIEKSKNGMEKVLNERSTGWYKTALSEMQEGLNPQYIVFQEKKRKKWIQNFQHHDVSWLSNLTSVKK